MAGWRDEATISDGMNGPISSSGGRGMHSSSVQNAILC